MKINDLLIELNMSPTSLKTQAANIDALVGIEFEMYVPGANVPDENDLEMVPDMDQDIRPYDMEDITTFYSHGDNPMGRHEQSSLKERLQEEYSEYINEEIDRRWASDGFEYFKENFDTDNLDDDETVEDVWQQQGREYWAAHSQFFDAEHENPPSEREWLSDRGWATMEAINDHFGFTWPYSKSEEPDDVQWEMDDIAESFSQALGRGVSVEGDGGNGEYGLTTDGSLDKPKNKADGGLEFISPPLSISEIFSDLQEVRRWAKQHNCYTGNKTGLHINVSIRNADWAKLDYVKLAILSGDQYVLAQFGRKGNTYAKSAFEIIDRRIRANPDMAFNMLATMKQHMNAIASRIIHDLATEKYTSINLQLNFDPGKQRVEFRSPGGDYLGKNFDLIENTVLRFVVALDSALDPEKDKKEYISKLYKMLRGSTGSGFDITKFFAEFAAGDMTKGELQSMIRLFKPPGGKSLPAALPQEPAKQKAAAGSTQIQNKASTQLNTYLHNVANAIAKVPSADRERLIKELVTVMADRSGYPEWKNAVPIAKSIIQRSGIDRSMIDNSVRAVTSGNSLTITA